MGAWYKRYKGEILNFSGILLWSFFPIVGKLSFRSISPLYSAAFMALFAVLFFTVVVSFQKKWHDVFHPSAWKDILYGSFLIGVLYYAVVFWGLHYTSAGNAAIINLMEVFFTFLLFGLWQKEKHKKLHILGAFLMVFGAVFILFPGSFTLSKGDVIIFCATIIPPLGNFYQKEARKKVSAGFIMFGRSFVSSLFLFLFAFLFDPFPGTAQLEKTIPLLILSGIFLFGLSKILYIESLHYISVSRAIAMFAAAPCFTLFIAYFLLHETPQFWQLIGLLPIIIGTVLLTKNSAPSLLQNEPY